MLPAAFASDPERLQRFEQEARAAAALNHPNILAVHDIGRCDGAPFIVSELLEGATLRERLQGGAVAVRKVIEYGVHIAKGLAAAHEKGIIHRDLKPENLFVTDDGRVKILDFGLAKLSQAEPALAGLSVLPAAAPDTLPGMVLGTIGYMAPEQVLVTAVLVAAVAIGAATYALLPGTQGVLDSRSYHASLLPPPNVSVGAGSRALALSPDGRTLAFVGRSADGIDRLWLRSLAAPLTGQPVQGTERASAPFWSPDSRFVAFFSGDQIRRIDVNGGAPFTVSQIGPGGTSSGAWVAETIYFSTLNAPIQRVAASGGAPSAVTNLDATADEVGHLWPSFLPDGRHFLYLAMVRGGEGGGVFVGAVDSPERKLLLPGQTNAHYADGQILFVRDQTLMAQTFDVRALELIGEPVPVADPVRVGTGTAASFGAFTVSGTGVLAYLSDARMRSQLTWFDRSGRPRGTIGGQADYADVSLSPDGTRVAATIVDPARQTSDVWLYDLGRDVATRLTTDAADDLSPVWSPDGSRLAFASRRKGLLNIYEMARDGGGEAKLAEDRQRNLYANAWSPDGRYVMYNLGSTGSSTASNDLWMVPVSGDRTPLPWLHTAFSENRAQFSPGRSLGRVHLERDRSR